MSYATRSEMVARFGAEEIDDLDTDDGVRIESALADASAEIDAMISGLYTLPLPPGTYPALRAIAVRIAREGLYDEDTPDAVTRAATQARSDLAALGDERAHLIDQSGAAVAQRRDDRAQIVGPDPVMTDENFVGFNG